MRKTALFIFAQYTPYWLCYMRFLSFVFSSMVPKLESDSVSASKKRKSISMEVKLTIFTVKYFYGLDYYFISMLA